ncbi:MAG TPA: hypothetical protein VFE58_03470 [Tepidisphaeraceae bacterium]|jgi:uncharacterized protein YgiM (DUF1202 family)|nr:hypothetical protein [Tepidisphaeraceae bacterium]
MKNQARRFVLLSTLSLTVAGVVPAALAQVVPPVENAKFGATGTVNADAVAVHSGPGENYYPTAHLDKGASVTVLGVKFEWLKILPPDGSFSYVAKQYIEKTGDTTGKATRANVNVRVGSTLTPLKATIQCQLQTDDKVEILGEAEEYYKIKPPAGAYLYINKQYVDATKMLGPTDQIVKQPATASSGVASTDTGTTPAGEGTIPTTPPAISNDPNAATAEKLSTATTRPSSEVSTAIDGYMQAEKDFIAASAQPIEQQPIDQLTQTYTALAANEKLPASMRSNANIRLATLKIRGDAQASIAAVRKSQDEAKQREAALSAEQQQLEAKLNGNRVLIYAAMGQLSTSTLKAGDTPIYRLTDPANGRTLVYIRGTDPSLPGMLSQFVGVKGDIVSDPQLDVKIITPKSIETLDPTKINAAAAEIQPLSLKNTASTNDK